MDLRLGGIAGPAAMRVLRCYVALPPRPGGMERHVARLSTLQREAGVEVIQAYCVGRLDDAGSGFRVLGGVDITRWRPQVLRDLAFYVAVCVRVLRHKVTANVVHVHGDWSAYLFGAILKRCTGAEALVCSMHGHMHAGWLRARLYRFGARFADAGYATGAREARWLTEFGQRQWQHITSGVDDGFFESDDRIARVTDVVIVGSMVPVKGLELAVDVARRLPHRTFRFIGDGPERSRLQALAAGSKNVSFVGALETDGVARELSRARLLLSTSLKEGTPTAMLEGMASGLAVVTTESNDLEHLLGGGEGGAVVSERRAQVVADAIESILGKPDMLARVSTRNRAVAEKHRWSQVAARVTFLMRSVCHSPQAPSNPG